MTAVWPQQLATETDNTPFSNYSSVPANNNLKFRLVICSATHFQCFLAQHSTSLDSRLLFAGTEAQFESGLLKHSITFDLINSSTLPKSNLSTCYSNNPFPINASVPANNYLKSRADARKEQMQKSCGAFFTHFPSQSAKHLIV